MRVEGGLEGEGSWEGESVHFSGAGGDGVVVGPGEEVGWRVGEFVVLIGVIGGGGVVGVHLQAVAVVLRRRGLLHVGSG